MGKKDKIRDRELQEELDAADKEIKATAIFIIFLLVIWLILYTLK